MCSADCLLIFIAILFPPLPVWIKRGLCSPDSLINIALCCLGGIPGLIHSWYIICNTPDYYEYERVIDIEGGRPVSGYYVVATPREQGYGTVQGSQPQPRPQPQSQPQPNNSNQGHSSEEIPPTYHEAIQGDNKIQKP